MKPLEGPERFDRTGVVTRSLFGVHLEVPLSEGFPLLTTKRSTSNPFSVSFFGFYGERQIFVAFTGIRLPFGMNGPMRMASWGRYTGIRGGLDPVTEGKRMTSFRP